MGVDYTAFSCFGVRVDIDIKHKYAVEDGLIQTPFEIFEYGSRQYGGPHGFILALKDSYVSVDFEGDELVRELERIDGRVTRGLTETAKAFELPTKGEPRWFVCGLVH
jgi:hypothetical protein